MNVNPKKAIEPLNHNSVLINDTNFIRLVSSMFPVNVMIGIRIYEIKRQF